MSLEDKTIRCADCGNGFTFTASEQQFFAEKGFTNEPRRCSACRRKRRDQRSDGPQMRREW
ncbi:MAG: zinc-ribbon domain-containing protein [Chloroflexota bacterium]